MAKKSKDTTVDRGGRPALYSNPEDLERMADSYFNKCATDEINLTITGLCLYLGFESKQSFYDYEKRDGFTYSIRRLRMKIENAYEQRLHGPGCGGSIFALKNFDWKDKQEIDHKNNGDSFNNLSDAELLAIAAKLTNPETKE
jgi:hypothetical protein